MSAVVLPAAQIAVVVFALLVPWWLLRSPRRIPTGRQAAMARDTRRPKVSVIVPARNEERALPALLGSLRASTVPVAEIVVVDDGSVDATAQVAASHGARVVDPGEPPSGWTGKAWACHVGAAHSSGEVLLFVDADTTLGAEAVAGLLAVHRERGGLVSVQPFHRVERPYEQTSAYFNAVAVLASEAFTGHPPDRPVAFGPCLLTSRADLERAGGHEAVRGEILDDIRLAAAFHGAGLPVTCALGSDVMSMRSYPDGPRQLIAGWSKNIASGAVATGARASVATAVWLGAHHIVMVAGIMALVGLVSGAGASGPTSVVPAVVWAVAWMVVAVQLRWVLAQVGGFAWWTWAVFPIPLLAFDAIFLRSAVLTAVRRSVSWRGRPVDLRRDTTVSERI